MNTSNLLNHNGTIATININNAYDKENNIITVSKSWDQLTDSDKQTIASDWIKGHIYCNVNQVMELLSQNDDHGDMNEYMSISEYQNFDQVSVDHINDLTIDELIEIAEDLDDVDHVELFKTKYLDDLLENTNNTNFTIENAFHELDITFLQCLDKEVEDYNQIGIEKELTNFFMLNYDSFSFDDLDICITNLGINFDGYLKAYQSDLADLITSDIDLEQYGKDNDLDCDYEEACEFYSVSDHFVSMLSNSEQCSNDILGLSVWARYCTGQSIVLDHQIQVAAFKVLSDCSFEYY